MKRTRIERRWGILLLSIKPGLVLGLIDRLRDHTG